MWKGHTHSSRGSEEEDDGVAQRVSLGWKAAFDEREETGIQGSYLRLNPLKKRRGRAKVIQMCNDSQQLKIFLNCWRRHIANSVCVRNRSEHELKLEDKDYQGYYSSRNV